MKESNQAKFGEGIQKVKDGHVDVANLDDANVDDTIDCVDSIGNGFESTQMVRDFICRATGHDTSETASKASLTQYNTSNSQNYLF